ncbi:efflux RND transporter periplasmic adaptor subunit [Anaerobaca lacustris]|uniref:Efflux RND transporter periplasmic adaptor subunit n=1 Tax=Anaerobaca lacustris TaxID=3044600 RepID=A0AAW6U545_9BACT|nr:efflux RND transporter periplasmic adaptor subunit [Sedimentisphaerales bacterium M17dextr]
MSDQSQKGRLARGGSGRVRRIATKAIVALAAVGAVVAIAMMPQPSTETPPAEAPPVNVAVLEIVPEAELADTFTLPAVIDPNRVVTVSAEAAASIDRIPPKEGEPVQKGDLLVQLNADLIRPQFATAEARYQRDQIEYERMKSLVKDDAAPQQDLDNAVTQLAASRAAFEDARARLDRTRILAPAHGVLNRLLVEEGEYVSPGDPVAEIVEIDTVKVVVDIPERDIGFFSVGHEAEVLAETKGCEKSFVGRITYINQLANRLTRSTPIEITLDNRAGLVRSGQIVRVRLSRRVLNDAIMVPLLAVIPMEDGYAVYVVEGAQARRRDVQLGVIKGDRVQIVSGLKPGDKLIVAGHRFVAPGQNVHVESEMK